MNRSFVDLHLRATLNEIQNFISKAAELGYSQIGVPFSESFSQNDLDTLRRKFQTYGLDLVTRIDYRPRNPDDLIRFLRRFRRQFEVICILCDNKEVARQAAKDNRVDILNFPSLDYRKRFFDYAEAELASNTDVSLEIDFKPLLLLEGPSRARLLSILRRETMVANQYKIPVLFSSGVSELILMRKPRDLASLGFLFGFQEEQALCAVSKNPSGIVERNRQKLDSRYVAPGITVLREEDP